MTWGELSDDLLTWTMPGQRTKNGAVHVVPLSKPARDLLRGLLPNDATDQKRVIADRSAAGALVLPGAVNTPFSGWSKAKAGLDRAVAEARAAAAAATGEGYAPFAPWRAYTICAERLRQACSALGSG